MMENSVPGIRNTARALIVRGGRILLLRKRSDGGGERYVLPGGAQEPGETLEQALNRECLEEIGTEVAIRDLLHVADRFKPRAAAPATARQRVEFLFDCAVPDSYRARNGHRPDRNQQDVVWMDLEEVPRIPILPRALGCCLADYPANGRGVYLGAIERAVPAMNDMNSPDLDAFAAKLCGGAEPIAAELHLALDGCTLRLRSNSPPLVERLQDYFCPAVCAAVEAPELDLVAIERETADLGVAFADWNGGPRQSGRRNACHDLPGGRLVQEADTGMVFLQSARHRIAAGPCLAHTGQVIDFIDAQFMNRLQHREWLMCRAAGVVHNGRALGIAGLPGGGSALMLRLLDHDGVAYLGDGHLFIRTRSGETRAAGTARMPRVDAGTVLRNPRLHGLMSAGQREAVRALPADALGHLEKEYDVPVERIYGHGRIVSQAPLAGIVVLNWRRDADGPAAVKQVDLAGRRDLLQAIMEPPGPFCQHADGSFFRDTKEPDEETYLNALLGVPIYEIRGGVDFDAVTGACLHDLIP